MEFLHIIQNIFLMFIERLECNFFFFKLVFFIWVTATFPVLPDLLFYVGKSPIQTSIEETIKKITQYAQLQYQID